MRFSPSADTVCEILYVQTITVTSTARESDFWSFYKPLILFIFRARQQNMHLFCDFYFYQIRASQHHGTYFFWHCCEAWGHTQKPFKLSYTLEHVTCFLFVFLSFFCFFTNKPLFLPKLFIAAILTVSKAVIVAGDDELLCLYKILWYGFVLLERVFLMNLELLMF